MGTNRYVYLRTDPTTGAEYVGKSKSPEAYKRRRAAHNRKLRQQTGNPKANYKFSELEEGIVDKDKLAFAEENNIRKKGGIAKDGGPLENKIHAMNDKKYKDMGGDLDKTKNKISPCKK
ncbi:MAG: hypothetical protein ACK5L5_04600 [Bacteroidales bacterium]